MLKSVKRLLRMLFGKELDVEFRFFNMILAAGCIASALGVLISLMASASMASILITAALGAETTLMLFIANRYKRYKLFSILAVLTVNLVFFPMIFFTGGGINSSMNSWFLLGVLFNCLLISDKAFPVCLSLTLMCFSACYFISYIYPESVIPLGSTFDVYVDAYIGMVVVSMIAGILLKYQKHLYKQEQELSRRQQIELGEANKTKSRFLANMSHEIRTPINTIIGLNEMNLRENVPAEVEENCLNIQQASKLLLSLINDILDLSKIESGNMQIIPREYETGVLLSELVNINWVRAHEKKLEFKLDVSPEIPSMLYGDDMRIRQILTNILTNAIKYTHKGSITLHAESEQLDSNNVRLKFSVADTGVGIRKEDVKDLFTSFKRVDEKRNSAIEGTGLGLAISHQLAVLMGGKITVDSIYGKGSTFTLTLEQKIVSADPLGQLEQLLQSGSRRLKKYHQSFEAPAAKVLVVDDNEMNRIVALKLLRDTKAQVDAASSGAQCLEMASNKYYHVIFMDHMMPEMDGIETLKLLRSQPASLCGKTPVIALTANAVPGAGKSYIDAGFQDYLMKPVNGALLEAMLLKYLPRELVELHDGHALDDETIAPAVQLFHKLAKRRLLITTDSVCDLPERFISRFNIRQINYYITTEQGRFMDSSELSASNMVAYLRTAEASARADAPAAEDYEGFFANELSHAEQIIHISMAAGSSNGYAHACQAAKGFDNVFVVDSGQAISGVGLVALSAASMAEQGYTADEILTRIGHVSKNVCSSFIASNAQSLYRAGKISRRTKRFFDAFQLHPAFAMKNGKMVCSRVYAGSDESAANRYIRHCLKGKRGIDPGILIITCAGCALKDRQRIRQQAERYQKFDNIIEQEASAAICSNYGLGMFGLFYIKASSEPQSKTLFKQEIL